MGTLTGLSAPTVVRGPRQPGRLGARPSACGSGVEALHTEIDNPFDLVSGADLVVPEQRGEFFRAVGRAAWQRQTERGWVSRMPVRLRRLVAHD